MFNSFASGRSEEPDGGRRCFQPLSLSDSRDHREVNKNVVYFTGQGIESPDPIAVKAGG
jgi:hypothetical protein